MESLELLAKRSHEALLSAALQLPSENHPPRAKRSGPYPNGIARQSPGSAGGTTANPGYWVVIGPTPRWVASGILPSKSNGGEERTILGAVPGSSQPSGEVRIVQGVGRKGGK